MENKELIMRLEANNNTIVWEHGGCIFIDSEKPIRRFLPDIEEAGREVLIAHQATKEQMHFAMSGEGACQTPTIGGRKTIANVYMVVG